MASKIWKWIKIILLIIVIIIVVGWIYNALTRGSATNPINVVTDTAQKIVQDAKNAVMGQ